MAYRLPPVIAGLHRRKAAYQRSLLGAWAGVGVLISMVAVLVIISGPTAILTGPNTAETAWPDLSNPGFQPPPPTQGHPASGGFGRLGATGYRVVRDLASPPTGAIFRPVNILPAPSVSDDPPVTELFAPETDAGGRGFGFGALGEDGNFGLPDEPLWAEALASARYPGWGPESIRPGYGSPAVIEWVEPEYPRPAYPHHALVRIVLTVATDGTHTSRLLCVDLWREVDSAAVDSVTLPIDPFGFCRAVLDALDRCMFWSAKDFRGNRFTGDYLISYHFCPSCTPRRDVVVSQRGQIQVRSRRF